MATLNKANSQMADKSGDALIGDRQSNVADAVVAHSITDADTNLGTTTEAELEGYFDALGVKINACLDVLEEHGLMTAS